jgi:hypothetical protein
MISEFKLIALVTLIYVLLDHFGGLRLVEKSLKNSGSNMIILGKASFIIVLLILLNKLMKRFKILEGQSNNINTLQGLNEQVEILAPGGYKPILDLLENKGDLISGIEMYKPVEICYEHIKNFNPDHHLESLMCIKLRLVNGGHCDESNDKPENPCLDIKITEHMELIEDTGISKNQILKSLLHGTLNDTQTIHSLSINILLDRIIHALKHNKENIRLQKDITERILHESKYTNIGENGNILNSDEIKLLNSAIEYYNSKIINNNNNDE